MIDLKVLIDLSEEVAIQKLKRASLDFRIIMRDDEPFVIKSDIRFDRANLTIKSGRVINAYFG